MTEEIRQEAPKKPGFFRKFLIIITLLLVLAAFGGVVFMQDMIATKKAEVAANMPETVSNVTVMTVENQSWTPVLSAVGTVRPNQGAMLSSQISGTVIRVAVRSGERVRKGQLLVEVDSSAERANLKASEAQLPTALANYNRYKNLVATNSASRMELDNAKSTYDALVANIEALKEQMARRQIYAPFEGTAGIVQINVGQFITAGTEIVRVEDQSSMKIRFTLPQSDLAKVKIGQQVTAEFDALPNETFTARISAIEPAVDRATGLVNLEATVAKGAGKLLSGMFARLNIEMPAQEDQIIVPQIAVAYTMYGETVYVLQPLSDEDKEKVSKMAENNPALKVDNIYRVKQTEVKTLERRGILAQLQSGIKAGDMIVTGGMQRLSNNSLVSISDREPVGVTEPEVKGKL